MWGQFGNIVRTYKSVIKSLFLLVFRLWLSLILFEKARLNYGRFSSRPYSSDVMAEIRSYIGICALCTILTEKLANAHLLETKEKKRKEINVNSAAPKTSKMGAHKNIDLYDERIYRKVSYLASSALLPRDCPLIEEVNISSRPSAPLGIEAKY